MATDKLPFNYSNFRALELEVKELRDLLLKTSARLNLSESKGEEKAGEAKTAKPKAKAKAK